MFPDIKGRWSEQSINRVAKTGLMTGDEHGFRPVDNLTREEMASILDRLMFRDGLFSDILPEIMPAIVLVHAGEWMGSGAFITTSGHIITNAHVVGDKQELTIIKDGRQNITAKVVAKSGTHDLALLKANVTPPAVLNISAADVQRGDHVGILGSPKGYSDSFTQGQVSHPERGDTFQADAPVNPGNSGGVAINERGEIVGIVVSKYVAVDTEGIAFVIHAKHVAEFLGQCGVDFSGKKPKDPSRLSEHFTKQEFTCKCGCGEVKVDPKLIDLLGKLRLEVGKPVYITSGYRCPKHNKAVGGAADSYHMKGMAADITIPQHSPYDIKVIARRLGFGGIGTYTNGGNFFCHVDVGPVREWTD